MYTRKEVLARIVPESERYASSRRQSVQVPKCKRKDKLPVQRWPYLGHRMWDSYLWYSSHWNVPYLSKRLHWYDLVSLTKDASSMYSVHALYYYSSVPSISTPCYCSTVLHCTLYGMSGTGFYEYLSGAACHYHSNKAQSLTLGRIELASSVKYMHAYLSGDQWQWATIKRF